MAVLRWLAIAITFVACGGATQAPSISPFPNEAMPAADAGAAKTFVDGGGGEPESAHVALGIPVDGDPTDDWITLKRLYALSYNEHKHVANWVAWNLNRSHFGTAPRRDAYRADESLPTRFYRVTKGDYAHSGYDRGHLCPSAERTSSAEDNALTFLMTNMQPQLHELNAGPWKELEEYEQDLTRNEKKELYIVAGGVFVSNPPTIGPRIAVPRASFKIIVVLEQGQGASSVTPDTPVVAVVMPNEAGVSKKTWREYGVTIDEVERQTGYDFLTRLPVPIQERLEAKR